MTVRDQLRDAYKASKLTQDEIAHRAGVSSKTLWNMLAGRRVRIDSVIAVAQVLKLPEIRIDS